MDIDHEAKKHKVPPKKVAGEAARTVAEDPSDQIRDTLDDAKDQVGADPRDTDTDTDTEDNH